MAMEPRLAERRKGVSEDHARSRLKRVLIVLLVLLIGVGSIWLIRSPVLSIRSVEVVGATHSDPQRVITELGMGQGTPTIDVDAGRLQAAIATDPWVKEVTVAVSWPGRIAVSVVERTPFASVMAGDRWVTVSDDGAVLIVEDPLPKAPRIEIDAGPVSIGYELSSPLIIGGLQFAAALSPELMNQVVVATDGDGDGLVATLVGHHIDLGRPVDMEEKATVLMALLDAGIEPGAQINLIAPMRPAVTNPQPPVEDEE